MDFPTIIGLLLLALFMSWHISRRANKAATFIKNNEAASNLTKKAAESLFKRLFG